MTPALRKCMSCRERSVSPTTLPTYSAELEHDGRKYSVTVNDFRVLQCQRCGVIVLDDSANETLSHALRREAGLLGPEEDHSLRFLLPSFEPGPFWAWFKVATLAGDNSWVAGVELAIASEPPARRSRIWGRRPPGVDPSHSEL